MSMDWNKLLQNKRFREGGQKRDFDGRNHFEDDYSRLISSSFVRRLQDKTQVFPLHQSDFIRTRLTHSLEVSSIAKSIGKSIEKVLIDNRDMDASLKELLPCLLGTAGLVHDLGNPPYGHFGEVAIQRYFKNYFDDGKAHTPKRTQAQLDFIKFDGNVQTFRILTKLSFLNDQHSYNLTFPTLASIVKYPFDSVNGNQGSGEDVTKKKFGYFSTEESQYKIISAELGLNAARHPATFLLEASDDIAYSAADIEDGVKLNSLNYEIIYDVFKSHLATPSELEKEVLQKLEQYKTDAKILKGDQIGNVVSRFRIFTQVQMIQAVIIKFLEKHDDILAGNYKQELLLDSDCANIRKAFKELSGIVFKDPKVMQAEIAGHEIITGLLDKFVSAAGSSEFHEKGKGLEGHCFNMISTSLRHIYTKYPSAMHDDYQKIQLILDFVSGMTDTYALNYYKGLIGMNY